MTAPPSTRSTGARRWRLVRAHPDAVPYSVRRFMRRPEGGAPGTSRRGSPAGRGGSARRRRRRAMWTVVATLVATVAVAAWASYGTSLLGVREVRVTGTAVLTEDEVRRAAGVRAGTPLARVDLPAVRARVARLAPVDRVTVGRDWPGTVLVRVTERTAVAAVPQGKQFLLVDPAGVAFDTVAARPVGLPPVTVKSAADIPVGVQVLVALTPRLRAELVSITVDGPVRIRLALAGGRQVVWGDASQSELKAKVATALLARDGETFDVSAPDVVTIR
jgi:cell division protein FtsQ